MRHICRTDIISDLNVNIKSNNLTLTQWIKKIHKFTDDLMYYSVQKLIPA